MNAAPAGDAFDDLVKIVNRVQEIAVREIPDAKSIPQSYVNDVCRASLTKGNDSRYGRTSASDEAFAKLTAAFNAVVAAEQARGEADRDAKLLELADEIEVLRWALSSAAVRAVNALGDRIKDLRAEVHELG